MAARDPGYAEAIAAAVKDLDPALILYGLSGSELIRAGVRAGLRTCNEVFADRTYQSDGSLTSRKLQGAVITDFNKSVQQVMMMVEEQAVRTQSGDLISISADTVCIHGDHEGAEFFAKEMNRRLIAAGYLIKSFEAA
jgi:UPF0271 protein